MSLAGAIQTISALPFPLLQVVRSFCSYGKELGQEVGRFTGVFFRKEMTALHRLSVDVFRPISPDAKRPTESLVERIERAAHSPKMEHRALDAFRFLPIRSE